MTTCKFLVAGDVRGDFKTLFNKVSQINKKKGPFDFLLCVGSFFGEKEDPNWEHYIKNCKDIPLTIYILGPNNEGERRFYPENLNQVSEINKKIIYLGKSGKFTTCEGLRIGYLSGIEANRDSHEDWTFGGNDLKVFTKLFSEFPSVHVLVSSVWPEGISELTNSSLKPKHASKLLPSVLTGLRPWYVFAGSEGVFYERPPYMNFNSDGEFRGTTRFISLGQVGSSEKWIHALALVVSEKMTREEPQISNATACPFQNKEKNDTLNYRYDLSAGNSHGSTKRSNNRQDKKEKRMRIDPGEECWFCLSSQKQESHLIVSVGSEAYLSLNRGGLFSDHLNIFPIQHVPSLSQASQSVLSDVERFRSLVQTHFKKSGHQVLFYERYYKTYHSQIHCVPLPQRMVNIVEKVFIDKIEELDSVEFEVSDNLSVLDLPPHQNYFWASFPSGSNLLAKINTRFPLNFAREVMVDSKLMNDPEKADWRNCILPVEEERAIVNELRKSISY